MLKNKKALTLVEVMLAAVMVAIVSLALNAMLVNGITVWKYVTKSTPEIDMNLFFERFSADLRNTFYYQDSVFSGNEQNCSFPTLTSGKGLVSGFSKLSGRAKYYYDKESRAVELEYSNLSTPQNINKPEPRVLISDVKDAVFSYYFYDQQKKDFFWSPQWPPDKYYGTNTAMPLEVKVTIAVKNEETAITMTKTIKLPAGGLSQEERTGT